MWKRLCEIWYLLTRRRRNTDELAKTLCYSLHGVEEIKKMDNKPILLKTRKDGATISHINHTNIRSSTVIDLTPDWSKEDDKRLVESESEEPDHHFIKDKPV
jgi:hypothetical protein